MSIIVIANESSSDFPTGIDLKVLPRLFITACSVNANAAK